MVLRNYVVVRDDQAGCTTHNLQVPILKTDRHHPFTRHAGKRATKAFSPTSFFFFSISVVIVFYLYDYVGFMPTVFSGFFGGGGTREADSAW